MSDTEQPKQCNYQIGQIVYILSDKAEAIVPAIVVEELVHKKLDGNSVSWKVAIGPPEKNKVIASDEISGDIYMSLDEIQRVMVERLTSYVNGLVGTAQKRTEKWYGKITKPPIPQPTSNGKIDPADLLDTIDGREKAEEFRRLPSEPFNAQNEQRDTPLNHENLRIEAPINKGPLALSMINPNDPRASLRENIRRLAEVPEGELGEERRADSDEFIVTDDGRRIPVKYNIKQE